MAFYIGPGEPDKLKNETEKLLEDIEWDIKAKDFEAAKPKIRKAKDNAKADRNEEQLNKALALEEKIKAAEDAEKDKHSSFTVE